MRLVPVCMCGCVGVNIGKVSHRFIREGFCVFMRENETRLVYKGQDKFHDLWLMWRQVSLSFN